MDYKTILYERKGKITYITLNRPDVRNALNDTMGEELRDAFDKFDEDREAWVAILSGKGSCFCSGADVRQRQLRPREDLIRLGGPARVAAGGTLGIGRAVNWKPVIGAAHGYAIGLGFSLVGECDLVVAADDTKFQITEVQRGLGARWADIWFWGAGKFANEITMTGRFFSAQEAHQWGLVNKVVPFEQLMPEAERLANDIIANPPLSVRFSVRLSRWYLQKMTEEEYLYMEAMKMYLTEDFHESALAFVEKRKPVFKGK